MTGDPHHRDPGDICLTCGDVALELTVVEASGDDALCRADDGGTERVATELVGPLAPGDRVLVHAAVALAKLPYDGAEGAAGS